MKKILYIGCCLLLVSWQSQAQQAPAQHKRINVAVLIYPGVELMDFAGATDVFIKAGSLTKDSYHIYTIALEANAIQTEKGMIRLQPDYNSHTDYPKPDLFVIPGAAMETIAALKDSTDLLTFIRDMSARAGTTMSICTGAYLLGHAGLLKGRNATTHWFVADNFQETFPSLHLQKDVRFVEDGNIITASGITSGIDAAIYVVGKFNGPQLATIVSKAMQYVPHKEESWPKPVAGIKYVPGKNK
ncbi:DJ-1/PfpI family protein [Chitinophaga pendula]|uniref:DJ-1/PfpI family protein n=1 Tax=Chitinophaga TaxID=79328 RepID=UPI000BAEB807|nr:MULTISPECIES: DJ-1/PfpI family protein [Chitinophaga]ASZ11894.1 thiamine biosynthesis protein ThiJ [Chitinophaga sp. MD30]UCJ05081.1 DJ-1/PfpI family protein [Chitinophaga pendula]